MRVENRAEMMDKDKEINKMTMVDYSPEKAGVGGSIPSLATIKSATYKPSKTETCSKMFQNFGTCGVSSRTMKGGL